MRWIILVAIYIVCLPINAANLPGLVFGYECAQIDPKEVGFRCTMVSNDMGDIMRIHYTRDMKTVPEKEQQYSTYRYRALILRFFQLGGKHFIVTSDFWEKGKEKNCGRWRDKQFSYHCS